MFGDGGSAGMGFVLVSGHCAGVSMGLVTGMGVSLGLTVPTIASGHAANKSVGCPIW